MPSAKDKTLRRERILQFLRENQQATPPQVQRKDENSVRQKKRVTFNHGKQQRSFGDVMKVKENEGLVGLGLTSCLITKSSDTRMPAGDANILEERVEKKLSRRGSDSPGDSRFNRRPSGVRITGGESDPAVRNVRKLPRTDSECQFKSPGFDFLKTPQTEFSTQEVRLNPVAPIRKELKNKCDFFPKNVDNRPFKDQATQSLYRESSAQTLAYLPEISNKERAETFELFSLAKILPGEKPPGLHEVEILERSRRRWVFSESIKINSAKLIYKARNVAVNPKIRELLEAFEWEQWIEREEYIQECQMMRLQIVIKMFDKREREMHAASKIRIEKACEGIEKMRRAALRKNEIEYQRAMRRLDIKLANRPRKWLKPTSVQALGSPCSEFYSPLKRHGVDPARRNFESITGRRAFDMRIDDLEKRVNMKNVQCPFGKLKEWSKPKENAREYEQNFCNEANLQKLFEGLKTSRIQGTEVKARPHCMRKRIHAVERSSSTISDIYDYRKNSRYSHYSSKIDSSNLGTHPQPVGTFTTLKSPSRGNADLENLIHTYEGTYIGSIMQFLADEMDRLKQQRKLHFFTILAQRERSRREANEGGLRQKENEMRLLYEEIFQHSHSMTQDTSKKFIDTVLTRDIGDIVENEAAKTVREMAREIDDEIQKWLESFKLIQNPLTYIPLRLMHYDMVSPDLEATLRRHEKNLIAQYIVEDVIFGRVWEELEPFDVATTLTSDFIDRLIDNDLYLFSTDSETESDIPRKASSYEAESIIRKLIRQAVPGRRWLEETERIVADTYSDLFDNIFAEILDHIENPPVVLPSDLAFVEQSAGMFRVRNTQTKLRPTASPDSSFTGKYVGAQLLSLLQKFKEDNVTKELQTDELLNIDSECSEISDTFIRSQQFFKKKIAQSTDKDKDKDVRILSFVDEPYLGENLESQQGSPLSISPLRRSEPDETPETTNLIEQEEETNGTNGLPSTNNEEAEEAGEAEGESSSGEEILIYPKHESTLFSFR